MLPFLVAGLLLAGNGAAPTTAQCDAKPFTLKKPTPAPAKQVAEPKPKPVEPKLQLKPKQPKPLADCDKPPARKS
jgi:hypothetical protein